MHFAVCLRYADTACSWNSEDAFWANERYVSFMRQALVVGGREKGEEEKRRREEKKM